MNAENDRETWLLSARTYFVPRRTQLVRVAVRDIETARALRTELELLRRIQRCAAQRGVLPAAKNGPDWDQSQRLSDDRWELSEIIEDASRLVVTDMIELFDQEFPSLRKEISMAVVNEEAENIVAEAVESGAAEPENKNLQSTDADSPPADSEQTMQPTDAAPVEKDPDQKDATEVDESKPDAVDANDGNADPIAALDQALAEAQSVLGDSGMAEPAASGDDGKQTEVDSKAEAMESNQADVTADSQSPDTTPDAGIDGNTNEVAVEEANKTIEQSDPQHADPQPTGSDDTSLSAKSDGSQNPNPSEQTIADAPTTTPQCGQQPQPPAAIEPEPDVPAPIEAKSDAASADYS